MAHVVLTTFGSLGDLHPYLALGVELRRRGHRVTVATHGLYRGRAEAEGFGFAAVRPDYDAWGDPRDTMREAMDERRGSEVVLRRLVLPHVRESFADLRAACLDADLIVDHVLTFAAPLVAESLGLPRVSTTLQPMSTFTAHDPPVLPAAPFMSVIGRVWPGAWRAFWTAARLGSRGWFTELDRLRAELGLPRSNVHPLFDHASAQGHLMLFSRVLMSPQPDWPAATTQPGFVRHDRGETGEGLSPELARWLDAGDPPIVFTLGSSAVFTAGSFYDAGAAAARALGRRAVLMVGLENLNTVAGVPDVAHAPLEATVVTVPYAPHSEVMPRACATVHQGGVGTTAQALLAGRPMLVVPFSHDQPDNAARCVRLGVARTLHRDRVSAAAFTRELGTLLADEDARAHAVAVATAVHAEPGVEGAVDRLEAVIALHPRHHPDGLPASAGPA